MITDESIARIREAADIVEIVGEHVKLRRTGADYRGPCPFHNGKGPNFAVSPKANAYHCFVCHAKGDSIGFVRDHLGLDFAEAVKYVAARAGVEVVEVHSARAAEERDRREPLWEANAAAAELFRELLWDESSDEARAAREYVASRGLTRADADRFQLGYAPRDAAAWRARLAAQGHDEARQLEVGLLGVREDGAPARARFRGRLMLPIQDAAGHVVGFGGRIIGDGEPKYLNTSQGPLFDKGRLLYGLSWAKHPIRKAERVLVVEGYFDAIQLALGGIEQAVAPNGTALTEHQAEALARLTRNVFLLYDSDKAGLKATFRAGIELLRHGVSARVVTLPSGEDPDTFVRAHGAAALEAQLAQAIDIFERQIQLLERRGWFAELHKTRSAVDKLLPTLRAATDPVTRDLYLSRLAEVSRIDRDVLQREADAPARRPGARGARAAQPLSSDAIAFADDVPLGAPPADHAPPADGPDGTPRYGDRPRWRRWREEGFDRPPATEITPDGVVWSETRGRDDGQQFRMRFNPGRRGGPGRRQEDWAAMRATPRVPPTARGKKAERQLVEAMLQERDLAEVVAERFDPGSFNDPALALIFERLLSERETPLDALTRDLDEAVVRLVDTLAEVRHPDPRGLVQAWLTRLQTWALDDEQAAILRRLQQTDPPPDDAEKDVLLIRKKALQEERAALSTHYGRIGAPRDRGADGGQGL